MVYQESLGWMFKEVADGNAAVQSYLNLREENEKLRMENERLKNLHSSNFLVDDRDSLFSNRNKVFLDDSATNETNENITRKFLWIRTRVIQKITYLANNSLVIGVGAVDGIKRGMPVVGTTGLIGKVMHVYPEYALVVTFFNSHFTLAAKCGKTGASGVLTWQPSNFFELTLSEIPVSDSAKVGDSIYSSHLSYHIPANILIGTVSQVKNISAYYDQLSVTPVEKITKSQSVYVIRDEQKEPSEEADLTPLNP